MSRPAGLAPGLRDPRQSDAKQHSAVEFLQGGENDQPLKLCFLYKYDF